MAEKRWLASRKKRSRDIREFITVHGKVIKPCPGQEQSGTHVSTTRQVRPYVIRYKEEVKIPASCFSKGVRKKTSCIATRTSRDSNVIESKETAVAAARGGKTGLTNLEEKENTTQLATVTKRNLLKRPAAKRDPLRVLPSGSPDRELPWSHSTSTPLMSPPVTMETTSSPLLFSPPNTSTCASQLSLFSMTEDSLPLKEGSCLSNKCTTYQPSDDVSALSLGGLYEPSPFSNMSFSFSDSLQIDSLSHGSWDTERLLAELSSCEKL